MKNDWWNQNHSKFNYQLEHDTRHLLYKFILRKEKGNWKVAFDINTILTIGMQKMKEQGLQNPKRLDDMLTELNNIGADSLKKDASEEMKKLDDVLKSIKIDSTQE